MKILFLLLPILTHAQYNFTKAEVDHAYNTTIAYKFDAEKWERVALQGQARLERVSNELAGVSDSLLAAINQRDELQRQHEADMLELDRLRRKKRWAVGGFAGYGAAASDAVRLAPMVGVGVMYKFFEF